MNTIQTEAAFMEKDFSCPPAQEWFDSRPNPVGWERIESKLKGLKVLDYGCASGWIAIKARSVFADVVAIDIFSTYCHPEIHCIKFDGENIPFPDGSFDAILTANTLHHLNDMTAGVVKLWNQLKPGGFFITFQEPCIPNSADEQEVLKLHCANEIENGICERRPNLKKYLTAFPTEQWDLFLFDASTPIWETVGIAREINLNKPDGFSGGIGIHAIKK